MSIVGSIYFLRGSPVVVLARWGKGGGPRNVLCEDTAGHRFVRPFRGLRKASGEGLLNWWVHSDPVQRPFNSPGSEAKPK